mgnify:FL=1
MRPLQVRDNKQYDVYYMLVSVIELWLHDSDIHLKDAEWMDLLSRLAEVEKQLRE